MPVYGIAIPVGLLQCNQKGCARERGPLRKLKLLVWNVYSRGSQSGALQLVFAAPETLCHLKETMQKSN